MYQQVIVYHGCILFPCGVDTDKKAEKIRAKTDAEIAINRENSRLRMQKMREREKTRDKRKPKCSFKTRQQIVKEEERLRKQRELKREYRSKLHPQKENEELKKRTKLLKC